jgi:uncharacterized membrane protein YbhN (UPF0104 family)
MGGGVDEEQPKPSKPAWRRWVTGVAIVVLIGAVANLLGWDLRGWLSEVWDTMTAISAQTVVVTCILYVIKTTLTAFAWYQILKYAYPSSTRWRDILAGYAVSVSLNNLLPANIGTFVMLVLFSVVIVGATFASILGAYAVEKIFWTVIGGFVYLYLFLSVGGSFDLKFAWLHEHPWGVVLGLAAGAYLLYVAARRMWPRVVKWWDQAKGGGAILAEPGKFMLWVFLPSFVAWVAMALSNATLMHAYGIPATFDTVMHVLGGNSLANVTSVTPGGAGVTQAFNVASLHGVASSQDATAFSVTSQVLSTAWNMVFAIVVVVWAWGWTGGRQLVSDSYRDAKKMEADQREKRKERKLAEEGAA